MVRWREKDMVLSWSSKIKVPADTTPGKNAEFTGGRLFSMGWGISVSDVSHSFTLCNI